MKEVRFNVEKTNTGFSAYAEDYSILATGETLVELFQDANDGLEDQCAYLEEDVNQYNITYYMGDYQLHDIKKSGLLLEDPIPPFNDYSILL